MAMAVLQREMLVGGRAGRQHVFRWLYAAWLILQLCFFYLIYAGSRWRGDPDAASQFAIGLTEIYLVQQFFVVLLATPTFAAGAITEEKTRGTLQYLLTAHVTPWEILVGKLAGRMLQVAILVLAGLPVLCFIGVFAGFYPVLFLVMLVSLLAALFGLGGASLLASVWARQTREAVLSLYTILLGGAALLWGCRELAAVLPDPLPGQSAALKTLLAWLGDRLHYCNPLWVIDPGWNGKGGQGEMAARLLAWVWLWGGLGAVCLGVAAWRLRPVYFKQLEAVGKKAGPGRQKYRDIGNAQPVLWKEQVIDGIAPFKFLTRVPTPIGLALVACLSAVTSAYLLWQSMTPMPRLGEAIGMVARLDFVKLHAMIDGQAAGQVFFAQGMVAMLLASLVVGIRCSGAVSGERERQSWEALLLTPLETRQLIRGKLYGILLAALPFVGAFAFPALLLALLGGLQTLFYTAVSTVMVLLAMYFLGTAGIWCSVRSKSSWRSLLGTMGFGYLGGFVVFALTSPIIFMVALIIYVILLLLDTWARTNVMAGFNFPQYWKVFWVASCVVLAVFFLLVSRFFFLSAAEKSVANRERTRHWEDERIYY